MDPAVDAQPNPPPDGDADGHSEAYADPAVHPSDADGRGAKASLG
jgi:hypothetical protein